MKMKKLLIGSWALGMVVTASQATAATVIPTHPNENLILNVDFSHQASIIQEVSFSMKVDRTPTTAVYPRFFSGLNGSGSSVFWPLLSPSFFLAENEATLSYRLSIIASAGQDVSGIADGIFSIVFTQSSASPLSLVSATVTARDQNNSLLPTITFAPGAIPEASTWIMMLAGFVGISLAMRRRAKVTTAVAYG